MKEYGNSVCVPEGAAQEEVDRVLAYNARATLGVYQFTLVDAPPFNCGRPECVEHHRGWYATTAD